jgi:hypothetical protein
MTPCSQTVTCSTLVAQRGNSRSNALQFLHEDCRKNNCCSLATPSQLAYPWLESYS